MSSDYDQLLNATIQHLENLNLHGTRFVEVAPETLAELKSPSRTTSPATPPRLTPPARRTEPAPLTLPAPSPVATPSQTNPAPTLSPASAALDPAAKAAAI